MKSSPSFVAYLRPSVITALASAITILSFLPSTHAQPVKAKSGATDPLDKRGIDASVRPQDNFYQYVNGKWLASVEIPADKARYGSFSILDDSTEQRLKKILSDLSNNSAIKSGTDAQKIRDLYASFMSESKLEELGIKPILPDLASIDAIHDVSQLPGAIASLANRSINVPMVIFVTPDSRDSAHYAPALYQAGNELPDRDYYLKDGEDGQYKKIRTAYERHIATMFNLASLPNAEQSAKQILQFETSLAQAQWDKVSNRDPIKTYNKYAIAELDKVATQFDWSSFLQSSGVYGKSDFLLIAQPSYVTAVTKMMKEVPLDNWKIYLKWKVLSGAAPYLSKAFVDEDFAFEEKTVSGTPEMRARWKRGLNFVEGAIGESLGKLYVAQYFPQDYKRHMLILVNNLLAAYRESINKLDWMSPATKQEAQTKLSKLTVKIGYPDKWRDYSTLQISADDLWGNVVRADKFAHQYNLDKLGKPVDRSEWGMTPQTINAYYNPEFNEIVFPAAILQPPFFDMQADDAINYGAIGAVIGHEISHGFDDQGSQFDGNGNLRDWWTKEDHDKFASKTNALVAQYAAYESVPGYHLNGKLTLGENIADLSGLAISFKAYQLSLKGKPSTVINGFTGEQRFFIGYARAWQAKSRLQEAIRLVAIDPHSPPLFRVHGPLANLDAFYKAYNVKPGDKMYVPPDQRISIW